MVRHFYNPKRINIHTNMKNEHPYYVWGVLYRERAFELIRGHRPHRAFSAMEIANLLYTNFDKLYDHEKKRVVRTKLDRTLLFLSASHYVKQLYQVEHFEFKQAQIINLDAYQVDRRAVFQMEGMPTETMKQWTYQDMDKEWGKWIGRRNPVSRKYLVDLMEAGATVD